MFISRYMRLLVLGLSVWMGGAWVWSWAQSPAENASFSLLLQEYDAQMERYEQLYNRYLWRETVERRCASVDSFCAGGDSSIGYALLRSENYLLRAQAAYDGDKTEEATKSALLATLPIELLDKKTAAAQGKDSLYLRSQLIYIEAAAFAVLNQHKSADDYARSLNLRRVDELSQRLSRLPAAAVNDTLRAELSALLLLSKSLTLAYAAPRGDYAAALSLVRQAAEQLEKHRRSAPRLRTLRLVRPLVYAHWFFCSRASGQDANDFMYPLLRGITQYSFSYESRPLWLDSLQRLYTERRLTEYDIPFDSINSTLATNDLIALRMHALAGWLPEQDDSTKQQYLPAAYRSAQQLTKALVRDNYLKRGSMSREKILFAYYHCFEDAILIAQQLYERSKDVRYLQQIAAWIKSPLGWKRSAPFSCSPNCTKTNAAASRAYPIASWSRKMPCWSKSTDCATCS